MKLSWSNAFRLAAALVALSAFAGIALAHAVVGSTFIARLTALLH